jgi:hypothetical protein
MSLPALTAERPVDVARRALRAVVIPFFRGRPAKVVANDLGVCPRTVRNWQSGETGMSDEALAAAARVYPELRAHLRRIMFETEEGWDE